VAEFTQALAELRAGAAGTDAINAMYQLAYQDLRRLAHGRLQKSASGADLDTTSLVHESYLRFVSAAKIDLQDRAHFMVYAAKVMRSVVIDMVRRRMAERRGGGNVLLTLDTGIRDLIAKEEDLLPLDEALTALSRVDPQLVQIVEMRYFAGLPVEQIAEHLGHSPRTVFRQWEKARLVLFDALGEP
jgi:RNA polymerase sigma factor (TIGR02999 family)